MLTFIDSFLSPNIFITQSYSGKIVVIMFFLPLLLPRLQEAHNGIRSEAIAKPINFNGLFLIYKNSLISQKILFKTIN